MNTTESPSFFWKYLRKVRNIILFIILFVIFIALCTLYTKNTINLSEISLSEFLTTAILFIQLLLIWNIAYYLHIAGCPNFKCNCSCRDCTTPKPNHSPTYHYAYYGDDYYTSCVCSECMRPQHCPPCTEENKWKCKTCGTRSKTFSFFLTSFYIILCLLSFVPTFQFISKYLN